MNLRSFMPHAVVFAAFLALCPLGRASTTTITGTFTADNSVFSDPFTITSTEDFTFTTTSAASGGFLPVLTLYDVTTGLPVDASNSGFGDVSLMDTLTSGSYILYLTEFPNVGVGDLSSGFLFPTEPYETGMNCGLGNVSFINDITCSSTPLGSNYSLTVTETAVVAPTPEPSTLVLILAPAAGLIEVARRQRRTA